MLKQLDTLIGFAVVMSVVSLLITIITQMISSLLGLRGLNLADALEVMLHQISPALDKEARIRLIEHALTRPAISDSTLSMAEQWTDQVPILSWFRKRWKTASAIRAGELLAVLKDTAGVSPAQAKGWLNGLPTEANGMADFLSDIVNAIPAGQPELAPLIAEVKQASASLQTATKTATEAVVDEAQKTKRGDDFNQIRKTALQSAEKIAPVKIAALRILAALYQPTAASTAAIATLTAQLPGLAAVELTKANALIAELRDASNIALGNLETWFDSAQDRAQQWFAMHARVWTVISAIALAFLLQLDAFRLVTQLANDSDLRSRLITFSETTLQKKADEVFTNTLSLSAIQQAAVQQLKSSSHIPGLAGIGDLPPELTTRNAVAHWLKGQAETNALDAKNVLAEFDDILQRTAKDNYDRAGNEFASLTDSFSKTGFQLLPDPYPSVWSRQWSWPLRHLLGILASAALLSLGAPFWFNLLKSLTNLRPVLANEIEKDDQAKAAKKN